MEKHATPVFGEWGDNTPYTEKFEGVRRKTTTGVSSNPDRNQEPPRRSPLHPSTYKPEALGNSPKYQPHGRKTEDNHPWPAAGSPLHRERRHVNPLHQQHLDQGGHGSSHRSPYRAAPGAASPMQATNTARTPKHNATGLQTPDRRDTSQGHGPITPRRSRAKQGGRGYESVEDEVTVPPFGEWDDANAASGENYTGIFNRVRNDKLSPNSSAKHQPVYSANQEHKVQQTCPCCIL